MNSRLMLLTLCTALFAAVWAGDGGRPRGDVALAGSPRFVTRAVSSEPEFRLLAATVRPDTLRD